MTRRGFLKFLLGALSVLGLKGRFKLLLEAKKLSFKEAKFYRRLRS